MEAVIVVAKKQKKTKVKKTKKTSRRGLPTQVQLKRAGAECADFTEAEQQLGLSKPLTEIFAKHAKLAAAFERGRLIKNLSELASTAVTVAEAEEQLSLSPGQLAEMIENDTEISDTWGQARLAMILEVKGALTEEAKKARPAAVKQIEKIITTELAGSRGDLERVTIDQLAAVTGKTRQTIHNWVTKSGLDRNGDKTFNLAVFFAWFYEYARSIDSEKLSIEQLAAVTGKTRRTIYDWTTKHGMPQNSDRTYSITRFVAWYEGFINKKLTPSAAISTDPLKLAKAEKLELELANQRGHLLDRSMVVAGIIARYQQLVNSLNRKASDLAIGCANQPATAIAETLEDFFGQLKNQLCQVPSELRLATAAAAKLRELLEMIEPEGENQ